MEMFFHLFYNMFRFRIVLYFKVCGCPCHLMSVPADRTELPALEPVNIGKCPASRAPDDKVHDNRLMYFIPINIYRLPDTPINGLLIKTELKQMRVMVCSYPSIMCDDPRGGSVSLRICANTTLPRRARRGPEAGNLPEITGLNNFHDPGVNSPSCPFHQSQK
jgi:hypothetical protein